MKKQANIIQKSVSGKRKKGIVGGFFSSWFYSVDSVLDIILLALVFSISYRENMSIYQTLIYGVITSFLKDFTLFIFINIKTKGRYFAKIKSIHKNKKKAFWLTILGSISGGPLGFTLTTATILYNGAAYGSALSNFSPIIVIILCWKFLKTEISKYGWLGIILTIIGFLGLSFSKASNFNFNSKVLVGLLLTVLAIITWSFETFIAEYVEKLGEKSLNTDEKLFIKGCSSSFTNIFILLPFCYLLTYLNDLYWSQNNQIDVVNTMIKGIWTKWYSILLLLSIGGVVLIGRILYWYAIENAGGGRSDILYYMTVLWVPFLTIIFYFLKIPGFNSSSTLDDIKDYKYWTFLSIKIIGVIITTFTTINNDFTMKKYQKINEKEIIEKSQKQKLEQLKKLQNK